MARVVEDLAYMLNAIAGHDPKDPTSSSAPLADYASALRADVKGMVIGVPQRLHRRMRAAHGADRIETGGGSDQRA